MSINKKQTNNIIFLDFDGVVNTLWFREYPRNRNHPRGIYRFDYAMPQDGFVNNEQAIQWLNEIYKKVPFDIVVTSTWRIGNDCAKILYNSGLDKRIKIIGHTPILHSSRGKEIKQWIKENNFNGNFLILDDDADMDELEDFLIQTNEFIGITYVEVLKILERFGVYNERRNTKNGS